MCEAGVHCSAHVILKSAVVHLHTHRRQKYPHQDASPPHKGSAFVVDILGYHVIAPYKWKNQQKSPFFPGNHLLIQSHQPHLLVHRLCRAAQCQICWSSRSIWTTLTDVGSAAWSQKLDLMILMVRFQLRLFCVLMTKQTCWKIIVLKNSTTY